MTCQRESALMQRVGFRLGTVLRSMPDAQDVDCVVREDTVDKDIGAYRHQLSPARQASGASAARENHQTVTGHQQFTRDTGGCNRVLGRNVGSDPRNVSQRLG
jgi:hypothetical protein